MYANILRVITIISKLFVINRTDSMILFVCVIILHGNLYIEISNVRMQLEYMCIINLYIVYLNNNLKYSN